MKANDREFDWRLSEEEKMKAGALADKIEDTCKYLTSVYGKRENRPKLLREFFWANSQTGGLYLATSHGTGRATSSRAFSRVQIKKFHEVFWYGRVLDEGERRRQLLQLRNNC